MLHTISALKNEQSSKDGRDITPSFDVVSVREKANRVKKAEKVEDEGVGMMITLKMWIRLRSCDDGMAPAYGVLKDSVV